MKITATNLKRYAQVISTELMDALKASAQQRGVSLEAEVTLRLLANLAHPEFSESNSVLNKIIRQEFTSDDAVAECKRKRESARYQYEIEKLRLVLRFEPMLPRNFKETFLLIDVKEVSKIIKAELEAEDKEKKS